MSSPFWCVAQLVARQEGLALHMLGLEGFEVYAPRLRQRRRSHGRWIETRPLLFPAYIFVRGVLQWSRARWAPGVVRVIADGEQPAKVPDQVITALRRREKDGAIELPKPRGLTRGENVRILGGPFRGHLGLYEGMKPHERVEVLLHMLGGASHVTLARTDVVALE
jgi:transcriptional antiterminator RfaH